MAVKVSPRSRPARISSRSFAESRFSPASQGVCWASRLPGPAATRVAVDNEQPTARATSGSDNPEPRNSRTCRRCSGVK
jgi:hypothetical protein